MHHQQAKATEDKFWTSPSSNALNRLVSGSQVIDFQRELLEDTNHTVKLKFAFELIK